MAAPTFVASASAAQTTTSTGPLNVNVPTGTTNGDLLLLHVAVAAQDGLPTTPSGWTKIHDEVASTPHGHVYARIAASEPSNYGVSLSIASRYTLIMHAYRPASGSWSAVADSLAILRSVTNAASTTFNVPDIDLGVNTDMMLVSFATASHGSNTLTKPGAFTQAENLQTGTLSSAGCKSGGAYLSVTATQTSSGVTWTDSISVINTCFQLAVLNPGTALRRVVRWWEFATNNAGGSTVTIPVPAVSVGDLLITLVTGRQASGTFTITTPTGWAVIPNASLDFTIPSTTNHVVLGGFYRIADGTEGTSLVVTLSTTVNHQIGAMLDLGDSIRPIGSIAGDSSSDTTWTIPALTMSASTPATPVLAVLSGVRGDNLATAFPASHEAFFQVRSVNSSTGALMAVASKMETAANPASTSYTGSASLTNVGLRIGRGDPGVPRSWGQVI